MLQVADGSRVYGAQPEYRRMPEFRNSHGLGGLDVKLLPEEDTLVFRVNADVATEAWLDEREGPLTEVYHVLTSLGIQDISTEFFPDPYAFDRGSYDSPTPNHKTVMSNLANNEDVEIKKDDPHFHYTTEIAGGAVYDLLVVSLRKGNISIQDVLNKLYVSTKVDSDEALSDVPGGQLVS